MHVSVDEPGADVLALQIDNLAALVVANAGDAIARDRHVALMDLAGQHIDDPAVLEHQVRRLPPRRHVDSPLEFHPHLPTVVGSVPRRRAG